MLKIILGGIAALVIVAVALGAGWYFFIREDAEPKTNAQTIDDDLRTAVATSAAGQTPAASGDGLVFVILLEQSEASYIAGETLARVGLPSTAEGVTKDIEGTIYLTADGFDLDPANETKITVQVTNLKTSEERRDSRVRDALNVTEFPTATFVATSVSGLDTTIPPEQERTFQLTGQMTLHGVTKEVTWEVKARREGNIMTALATLEMLYSDFDITPPNIAGFVSVEDDVILQMDIVATSEG